MRVKLLIKNRIIVTYNVHLWAGGASDGSRYRQEFVISGALLDKSRFFYSEAVETALVCYVCACATGSFEIIYALGNCKLGAKKLLCDSLTSVRKRILKGQIHYCVEDLISGEYTIHHAIHS